MYIGCTSSIFTKDGGKSFKKDTEFVLREWMTNRIFSGSQVIEPAVTQAFPKSPKGLEKEPKLVELSFQPSEEAKDGYGFVTGLQAFFNSSSLVQAIPFEASFRNTLISIDYDPDQRSQKLRMRSTRHKVRFAIHVNSPLVRFATL